jgi:hypothetical protein
MAAALSAGAHLGCRLCTAALSYAGQDGDTFLR